MFLVFDLDGTLIDGYECITDALGFAMGRLGHTPLPVEKVRGMVGEGLERLLEKAVGQELVADGVRLFRERYAEIAEEKTRLMADAPAALAELAAAGHSMSVASNKPADFSRRILAAKGLAGFFEGVGGPGPGVPPKPHPEMLRRLIAQARAAVEETIVVGDMEIDSEFARSVGCRVVLVAGGSRSKEQLAGFDADARLARLAELPAWVARAQGSARPRIGR